MKSVDNILTKILSLWVVLGAFLGFIGIQSVDAQAAGLNVRATLNATILPDMATSRLEYVYTITNNTQQVVRYLSLPVPYKAANPPLFKYKDRVVTATQTIPGQWDVDLGLDAILPNTTDTFVVQMDASDFLFSIGGIHTVIVAPVVGDWGNASLELNLSWPMSMSSKLTYLGLRVATQSANSVTAQVLEGGMVIWADEDVYLDLEQKLTSAGQGQNVLFATPRDYELQTLAFSEMVGMQGLVKDSWGNLFKVVDQGIYPNSKTSFRLHNFKTGESNNPTLIDSGLAELSFPIKDKGTQFDKQSINQLLNYLAVNFRLTANIGYQNLTKVAEPPSSQDQSLLDMAVLVARGLKFLGAGEVEIVYGYYLADHPLAAKLNLNLPNLWVKFELNGKIEFLDIRGYFQYRWQPFWDSSAAMLMVGSWHQDFSPANVLGLGSGEYYPRPEYVVLGQIDSEHTIRIDVDFPKEVLAGSYVNGKLFVDNLSTVPLALTSVEINNLDVTQQLAGVNERFTALVAPRGRSEFKLPWYAGRDALAQTTTQIAVTVRVSDPLIPPEIIKREVVISPNYGLVGVTLGVIVLGGAFVAIMIFRQQVIVSVIKRRYLSK